MSRRILTSALALLCLVVAGWAATAAAAAEGDVALLSRVGLDGPPADDSSSTPLLSADGRLTVFTTAADNLVAEHDKAVGDVVLRDNGSGAIRLVSRASGPQGAGANAESTPEALGGDGRLVFFTSAATNLDPAATDGQSRLYVRDTVDQTTALVPLGDPADGPDSFIDVSRDGRFLLIDSTSNTSDANGQFPTRVVRRDRQTGETVLVSRADGAEGAPADGGTFGATGAISGDGAVVVFSSGADNLSAEDSNAVVNVFVRDLRSNTTRLVTRGANGAPADDSSSVGAITADGRYVAFVSLARNLTGEALGEGTNVFRWDATQGQTILASRATGPAGASSDKASNNASITDDGRFVAFASRATTLSTEDSDELEVTNRSRMTMAPEQDVFARDLGTDLTALISRSADTGPGAEASSFAGPIAAAAALVPFSSGAGNLSTQDSNAVVNVYARRVPPPPPVAPPPPPADTAAPAITALKVTPRRVRPGRRVRVAFTLSEAARVRIAFERRLPGVRSRGRCRATSRRRIPKAKRCTRRRTVRVVTVQRPTGATRVSVRLPRRGSRLAAGTYTVRITATDVAGNASSVTGRVRVR